MIETNEKKEAQVNKNKTHLNIGANEETVHMMATRIHGILAMRPSKSSLLSFALLITTTVFASLVVPISADAEWMNDCGVCKCKWISSKKQADCTQRNLVSVPKEMSNELQVIDLSSNIIAELRNSVFRDANLLNLHKIYLKNCTLQEIHRDAFKEMSLLIELDLSYNQLKVLYPGTFTDVFRLRVLIVTHNEIEHLGDNLFENLGFLAKVDFRYNSLKSISQYTFVNVTVIREIDLENNQLTVLKEESFRGMPSLRSLTLNQNPWNCTCDLLPFQKFSIAHGLYTPPTSCNLPMKLRGKLWTEVAPEHFACRPVILLPHDGYTIDATTENITITCKMKASPKPHIEWRYNNEALNEEDTRITVKYSEEENRLTQTTDLYSSDLIIVGVTPNDRGIYTCVATNTGGESKVEVHVIVPPVLESLDGLGIISSTAGIPTTNQTNLLFIICLIAIILLILLILLTLILCCYCRRVKKYSKNGSISENGLVSGKVDRSTDGSMLEGSVIMEMQKSLLTEVNPVEKPPRRSETDGKSIPSDDVQEIKKTLLDEQYGKRTIFISMDSNLTNFTLDNCIKY